MLMIVNIANPRLMASHADLGVHIDKNLLWENQQHGGVKQIALKRALEGP